MLINIMSSSCVFYRLWSLLKEYRYRIIAVIAIAINLIQTYVLINVADIMWYQHDNWRVYKTEEAKFAEYINYWFSAFADDMGFILILSNIELLLMLLLIPWLWAKHKGT